MGISYIDKRTDQPAGTQQATCVCVCVGISNPKVRVLVPHPPATTKSPSNEEIRRPSSRLPEKMDEDPGSQERDGNNNSERAADVERQLDGARLLRGLALELAGLVAELGYALFAGKLTVARLRGLHNLRARVFGVERNPAARNLLETNEGGVVALAPLLDLTARDGETEEGGVVGQRPGVHVARVVAEDVRDVARVR